MLRKRPLVFIGSSTEGLYVAKAIQAELEHTSECVIWHQGVFGLSEGTLESLVKALDTFDFAILALTPDDLVSNRSDNQPAPRDNVLLELGLFIAGLGRERTFMVVDRSAKLKLPSDLAGITPATFQPPVGGTWQSAVGPACTAIDDAIRKLGPRDRELAVEISGGLVMTGRHDQSVGFTVKNIGPKEIPPYKLGIFHPKLGTYFLFPPEKDKEGKSLLTDQVRKHVCKVIENRQLPEWFPHFNADRDGKPLHESDYDDFEFRIVLEDSDKVLYTHKGIGLAFVRLIHRTREHGGMLGGKGGGTGEDWARLSTLHYHRRN